MKPTGESNDVYRPDGWEAVAALFDGMDRSELSTVGTWLAERADRLLAGWQRQDRAAAGIVSNWHPDWVGRPAAEILAHQADQADARATVAREHGFPNWAAVEAAADRPLDLDFEDTVDRLLDGNLETLDRALRARPDLASARSAFGHGATLLHYVAANGVETERQVTPLNSAALVRRLLDAGADAAATMPVYGGEFNTLQLLTTSAHPAAAGVVDEVAALLQ